ncbi:MAG: DUF3853 family protein [Bacteroidales bacterium]|jgi:hypothetical protein|nr:DUF3853 family protein [Bacteroidales bacterium]
MTTNDTPVWQLTVGELKQLLYDTMPPAQPTQPAQSRQDRYVYGLDGLARLMGCSKSTAFRIVHSGMIDKAVVQVGRKIAVDADKAMDLLKMKKV